MRRYTIHCKKARDKEALSAKPDRWWLQNLSCNNEAAIAQAGAIAPHVALLRPVVLG